MREMTLFIEFGLHVFPLSVLLGSVMLYVEKRHDIKYKRVVFSFDFLDVQYRANIFRFIDLNTSVYLNFERLRTLLLFDYSRPIWYNYVRRIIPRRRFQLSS